MRQDIFFSRIWTDITGLAMPLLMMAAYVLGWSSAVRAVLTVLCFAGILGPWLLMTDWGRWRAEQAARLRRLASLRRPRRHA
jgi:hypothetical protein